MRLVIDLQGAQSTGSRHRGIGRYSLALAQAMARQAGEHELWIALNAAFKETIEPLRAAFDSLLPRERVVTWEVPTPIAENDPANSWRRQAGEVLYQSFLSDLRPDVVHVSSLFEGLGDDVVTPDHISAGNHETAVTVYDLIPLIHADSYLTNPVVERWYRRKLTSMRRAGIWLAISEASRRDAMDWLDLPPDKVVNISAAADARFRPIVLSDSQLWELRRRYGVKRPFVMYTGGIDYRKNIEALISAFSRLPERILRAHQLAIVCSASERNIADLLGHARRSGLGKEDLVITGFVPDDDLLALYNMCAAFCFPSWHEGFGLPVLEAMQCGAPTLGANTSSIPEVIGRPDALFDPFNQEEITAKLYQVLTDAQYRRSLVQHGLQQARKFSWEESARRAWRVFETHHESVDERAERPVRLALTKRPRLAYVSPLPPESSGIADYSAELLPELARYYDIEVIVAQSQVSDPWIRANCPIRDAEWFAANGSCFDRILYHFGNSYFHQHMFQLLNRYPGIVVLHDFYLGGVVAHMDLHGGQTGFWPSALYRSHGYCAVQERYHTKTLSKIIWKYPSNFPVLENASGVIVHSAYAVRLVHHFYGEILSDDLKVIPQMRRFPNTQDRKASRKALGLGHNDFLVCSFGITGPIKLNHRLLEAWIESSLHKFQNCHLVFVGEEDQGDYGIELRDRVKALAAGSRILITGFASQQLYLQYLCAADVAVQLRTLSRGETSRAVLDCMAHAIPTIVNAHGSMAELPSNCVVMLPDAFADDELVRALEQLHADPACRKALGERARCYLRDHLSPRVAAAQYQREIELFSSRSRVAREGRAVASLLAVDPARRSEGEWLAVARSLHRNSRAPRAQRQLLVDVSELVRWDTGTGIQRVARNVLQALLTTPPAGYRVEPVYATADKMGYSYARAFTMQSLECPRDLFVDAPVELRSGDMFLGLDLRPDVVLKQVDFYADMRRRGIEIHFVVYDLLPVLLPHLFHEGTGDIHARWLSVLGTYADGVVCISRSVADDLAQWLGMNGTPRERPLKIGWFHLGADIEKGARTDGLSHEGSLALAALTARASFVMVGTLEPRKAHAQVLAAFEHLWEAGCQINLVIVGKQGWMVEPLAAVLRTHPELGRRLFWLEQSSDETLEQIYAGGACLIAASEAEGFGLPLVEAARHKLPILTRDIPVFREVAGPHASYFSGSEPEDLAQAVSAWLALFADNRHPRSDDMPWLTWAESVERLKAILLQDDWYTAWPPGKEVAPTADGASPRARENAPAGLHA